MSRRDDVSPHYPPLTIAEAEDCTSDLRWRKRMLAEERRQSLALEKMVEILGTHGRELEQIREHFESWAPEES